MPRNRMQHLSEDLAEKILRIERLHPTERARVAYDARMILERTIKRIEADLDDLFFFFDNSVKFKWFRHYTFEMPVEAIMPKGPPIDAFQFTQKQASKTLQRFEAWSDEIDAIKERCDQVKDMLRGLGIIYLRKL